MSFLQIISGDRELQLIGGLALVAVVAGLVGLWLALRTLLRRRFFRLLSYGGGALLALAAGVFLALVLSNLYVYQRLTLEQPIARLQFSAVGPQHFRVVIRENSGYNSEFDLLGDEWQLDARVLKWKSWGQLLGLQPRYRLERLQGRYLDVARERSQRRSVYELAPRTGFDIWAWLQHESQWQWVDAVYGSAAYLPMVDGGTYTVNLGATGLIARPDNDIARKAVRDW